MRFKKKECFVYHYDAILRWFLIRKADVHITMFVIWRKQLSTYPFIKVQLIKKVDHTVSSSQSIRSTCAFVFFSAFQSHYSSKENIEGTGHRLPPGSGTSSCHHGGISSNATGGFFGASPVHMTGVESVGVSPTVTQTGRDSPTPRITQLYPPAPSKPPPPMSSNSPRPLVSNRLIEQVSEDLSASVTSTPIKKTNPLPVPLNLAVSTSLPMLCVKCQAAVVKAKGKTPPQQHQQILLPPEGPTSVSSEVASPAALASTSSRANTARATTGASPCSTHCSSPAYRQRAKSLR